MGQTTAPLSNLQIEFLKLYSAGVADEHLEDIKILIARFLFAKARAKADKIWDEKKYTDEIINDLIQQHG
jgi:DNA-binding MltR family transcriptional regulator